MKTLAYYRYALILCALTCVFCSHVQSPSEAYLAFLGDLKTKSLDKYTARMSTRYRDQVAAGAKNSQQPLDSFSEKQITRAFDEWNFPEPKVRNELIVGNKATIEALRPNGDWSKRYLIKEGNDWKVASEAEGLENPEAAVPDEAFIDAWSDGDYTLGILKNGKFSLMIVYPSSLITGTWTKSGNALHLKLESSDALFRKGESKQLEGMAEVILTEDDHLTFYYQDSVLSLSRYKRDPNNAPVEVR